MNEQGTVLADIPSGPGPGGVMSPGPASAPAAGRAALQAAVLEDISALLREVIGEDYVFDLEITCGTKFDEDLEMESIEFVDLAGRIRQRYGDRVDFVRFLAAFRLEQVRAMRVGDVVSYIVDSLVAGAAGRVNAHG
jgi:acyl carrier protein